MDIFWIIVWILLSLVGVAGSIIPWVPGPQLGYLGLLMVQFTLGFPFSRLFIVLWGIINIGLIASDYLLPIRWTKKFGGTKWGNVGCLIGIFVGLMGWPLGILFWPFVWALVGEYLHQQDIQKALKAALGAFLGFISGVVLKLIISVVMLGYLLAVSIQHFL